MIEYLRLERWRAYRHLELELGPGTTFVVARNGIGKTSLVEAASFAVTGSVPPASVVRAGEQDAEVEVHIRLPNGALLRVTRRVETVRRRQEVSTRATLDNTELEDGTESVLERAWRAPLGFVSQTAFLREHLYAGGMEGVRAQLARAFSVESLQAALGELDAAYEDLTRRTVASDREVRAETADRAALVAAAAEAEVLLAEARAARDAARVHLDAAEVAERAATATHAALERRLSWVAARDELLSHVRDIAGREVASEDLALAVRSRDDDAQTALADARSRVTELRTRLSMVTAAADELARSGATCPVCRRPLDDVSRAKAVAGHREEIEDLTAELQATGGDDVAERAAAARRLSDQVVALGPEPLVPLPSSVNEDTQSLREAWQAAVESAAVAQAAVDRTAASLAEMEADERRVAELRRMYRELALLEASRTATESTVRRVLAERVDPLLSVVGQRWKNLFPDRPDLHLDVDGTISRRVGGVDLPFDAFSTGERAAAQLLLRLVLVEATTSVGMCWVDEPLEHLDPTSRRLVGGMLAQAASASGERALHLRQVFVTTYEEPLARRIASSLEDANIVYVMATSAE